MSQEKSTSNGISFCGLLTIAFIVLKLCNVIMWSWVWVLAPSWIPLAIGLCVIPFYIYEVRKKHVSEFNEKRNMRVSNWQECYEQMMESQKKAEAAKNN